MSYDSNDNKTKDADMRLAVSELNQSIEYLSKMVLQLQRSINEQSPKKATKPKAVQKPKEPPVTIH